MYYSRPVDFTEKVQKRGNGGTVNTRLGMLYLTEQATGHDEAEWRISEWACAVLETNLVTNKSEVAGLKAGTPYGKDPSRIEERASISAKDGDFSTGSPLPSRTAQTRALRTRHANLSSEDGAEKGGK